MGPIRVETHKQGDWGTLPRDGVGVGPGDKPCWEQLLAVGARGPGSRREENGQVSRGVDRLLRESLGAALCCGHNTGEPGA